MDNRVIDVPAALLQNPELSAPVKVIWMALRLEPEAPPARVEALTGLARNTIRPGMAEAAGMQRPRGGRSVRVPAALLAERGVGPTAKVLYGLLQTHPNCRGSRGQFTYHDLAALTHLSPNTLKKAMTELNGAGWVKTHHQKTRLSPIGFRLGTPAARRAAAEAAVAERRLERAKYGGESIMQEYLSLLIDSQDFADNTRPGFLVNPLTQERLELDRFYVARKVAFEFHGDQHFRATERFTQKEVDDQRLRDLIKAGLCVYEGIHLVIVQAEELTLQGMLRKVDQLLPLRDLAGQERLIDLLEGASIKYLAKARTGG